MLYNFILNNLIIVLFILNILFYVTLRKISLYLKKQTNQKPLEILQNNPELFLKFLDSYYIKNKYYTFIGFLIYIFIDFFLIVLLRIISLGQSMYIKPNFFEYIVMEKMIIIFLSVLLLLLIRLLVQTIFYKETLKVYIFLMPYNFLINFCKKISIQEIIGPFNLFLYCVSTWNIRPMDEDEDYQEFYLYKNIYEKQWVLSLGAYFICLSNKYVFIQYLFKFLFYICNLIYEHMLLGRYTMYLLYLIMAIILFYDFINYEIYYIYYYLFIFFMLQAVYKYFVFFNKKNSKKDRKLYEYFYENAFKYQIQRYFIYEKTLYHYKDMENKSEQNKNIKLLIEKKNNSDYFYNFIEYTFYNLDTNKTLEREKKTSRKISHNYIIYTTLYFCTVILLYLNMNFNKYILIIKDIHISTLFIFIPITIILLSSLIYQKNRILVLPINAMEDHISCYIYNKKYVKMLWLTIIITTVILLTFFYQTHILEFFSDGAIYGIWEIKFYRYYTVEEKQKYFVYLLDQYFIHINYFYFDIEQLKLFREFKELILENINENTKIKDIQEVTLYIIQNCSKEISINVNNILMENNLSSDDSSFMHFTKNATNIIIFWKFFIANAELYLLIKDIRSMKTYKTIYPIIKFCVIFINRYHRYYR